MSGRFLLDTNIIIALFAKNVSIHKRMGNAEEVFVPCIAIGELYFGSYKSSKIQENIGRIDEFILNNTILPCNIDTAKKYGEIKNSLKDKGHPIPENDLWIAAIGRQYNLILVTRDTHFSMVDNLIIEEWFD